jgi:hypothetical protein
LHLVLYTRARAIAGGSSPVRVGRKTSKLAPVSADCLFDTCAVGTGRVFLAAKNENPRVGGSIPSLATSRKSVLSNALRERRPLGLSGLYCCKYLKST